MTLATAPVARPPYQLFPDLTPDEFDALAADIRERGVLVPVELDEDGAILDGHHRAKIADSLGIDYPTVTRDGLSESEKLEHVFALNIARRQLSGHDRTLVISECRARGMSLRAIAKAVGVSHETVRSAVKDLTPETLSTPPPETEPAPEPEPLPAPVTRAERARELAEAGASERAIAAELGIAQSTVHGLLNPGSGASAGPSIPVEWTRTKALLAEIKALPETAPEPRAFAASVPERNRASVAKTLRQVGTFLGSIALELERSGRK